LSRCRLEPEDIFATSAKSGLGVAALLPAIVRQIPPPRDAAAAVAAGESVVGSGDARYALPQSPLRARVVDSWFDDHRGVVCLVQVAARPP